jgi:molecular chaperone DnaK
MWNWWRSLRSWFFATPNQTSEQPTSRTFPSAYSAAPKQIQPTSLPLSSKKPPTLHWRPVAQTFVEEDTVAPPLTSGAADHSPILGIDLGTSYSVVAVVRQGKVEVIPNQEGEYRTPSVVTFNRDGQVLVGSPALHQAALNPQRTIYAIKRHLGRILVPDDTTYEIVDSPEGPQVRVEGAFFSPAEVSALILRQLLKSADAYLGWPVRRAVLTIPATFDDAQRQSTLDAALLAGLDLQWVIAKPNSGDGVLVPMRVITEPTAAALSLGIPRCPRKIAVVHMGGGTCDVGILDIGEGVIQAMAVSGDSALGGQDFDGVLIDWFIDTVRLQHGIDPRSDRVACWRLREAAEQAKQDLSQREMVRVKVPYLLEGPSGRLDLDLVLSRADLEQRAAHLIERCRSLILRCLKDARLKPAAIDEVLLVGGMMRMPRLRQLVREIFGRDPRGAVHSDEAVARGAAIQGAQLLLGSRGELVLVDVAPLTLGVEADDGTFVEMIPRNTNIPTEKAWTFTTAANAQPGVSIRIFQGDNPQTSRNQFLAQLDLDGLSPAPAGQPRIEVRFSMDHNGVVWVTARDQTSGREKTIRVARGRRLTPAEANDLRLKAERNAARRAQQDPLMAARGRAQACLDRLAGLLRSHPTLESTGVAQLRALAEEVRQMMLADDPAALQRAVDGLDLSLEALGDWLKRPKQSRCEYDALPQINLEL